MSDPSTLIAATDLASHVNEESWCVLDCRFSLNDPERGRRDFEKSHITNAAYVHLEEDLSGTVIAGRTGRHPLPDPTVFGRTLSRLGIDADVHVAVYDDGDASIAARLWWMLLWMGHQSVSVLDGGWAAWIAMNGAVSDLHRERKPRTFVPQIDATMLAILSEVDQVRQRNGWLLIDSRTEERFRGDSEPIDPVAGHIPGAINVPYITNLDAGGCLSTAAQLKIRFVEILDGIAPERTVFYCGSGVTAAHNLLAMQVAGLAGARMYVGSWSEWIIDPQRPVATGGV